MNKSSTGVIFRLNLIFSLNLSNNCDWDWNWKRVLTPEGSLAAWTVKEVTCSRRGSGGSRDEEGKWRARLNAVVGGRNADDGIAAIFVRSLKLQAAGTNNRFGWVPLNLLTIQFCGHHSSTFTQNWSYMWWSHHFKHKFSNEPIS